MEDKKKAYKLELNPEQAKIVSRACELYSRLHIGQLRELNEELLLSESTENICERREAAEELLYKLKEIYFPSLISLGHSHGLGKRKWADAAWNVRMSTRQFAIRELGMSTRRVACKCGLIRHVRWGWSLCPSVR